MDAEKNHIHTGKNVSFTLINDVRIMHTKYLPSLDLVTGWARDRDQDYTP